jgi:hypothetical protein
MIVPSAIVAVAGQKLAVATQSANTVLVLSTQPVLEQVSEPVAKPEKSEPATQVKVVVEERV